MPKTITKDQAKRLEELNSQVKFSVRTEMVLDANGDPKVNKLDNRPISKQITVAELFNKADGQKWLHAEDGDEETALEAVLKLAETASRPATTAVELMNENKALREKLAAAEARTAHVTKVASSQGIRPNDSQVRRSAAAEAATVAI